MEKIKTVDGFDIFVNGYGETLAGVFDGKLYHGMTLTTTSENLKQFPMSAGDILEGFPIEDWESKKEDIRDFLRSINKDHLLKTNDKKLTTNRMPKSKAKIPSIKPLPGIVYIKSDEVSSGMLDTSSRQSAVEVATVISVGKDVGSVSAGDRIFYKAWACDTITHEGTRYNFINIQTGGILAVVE